MNSESPSRIRERGTIVKALKAMIGIAVIVMAILVVTRIVPPYFHNYQLEDAIGEEARINTYTPKTAEAMRDSIFRKCQELEIPVTREQVNVRRDGQSVAIWIDYTVHVDLPIYPLDLQFHPASKNKMY
jgi:hypothetical protein